MQTIELHNILRYGFLIICDQFMYFLLVDCILSSCFNHKSQQIVYFNDVLMDQVVALQFYTKYY